jgi:hypothetical protein
LNPMECNKIFDQPTLASFEVPCGSCDWATCHSMSGPYNPVTCTVSLLSQHFHITIVPATLLSYMPCVSVRLFHVTIVPTTCHAATGPTSCTDFFRTLPHHLCTSFVLSLKMPNLPATCQPLVLPHHHDVLLKSSLTLTFFACLT